MGMKLEVGHASVEGDHLVFDGVLVTVEESEPNSVVILKLSPGLDAFPVPPFELHALANPEGGAPWA